MSNVTNVNSAQDTIYASSITYDVEKAIVENNIDPSTRSGKKEIQKAIDNSDKDLPSNLDYVDSFYDSSIGTSGTAFKDIKIGDDYALADSGSQFIEKLCYNIS